MKFEIFSKTIENKDHTSVCRFCLAENAMRRIQTKTIAHLFKQITNENLLLSPDYPTFVCNMCERKLQTAVKIRTDIAQIEKCWKQYIDAMPLLSEIKIEALDDEYGGFETVEMVIEPVQQEDVEYLNTNSNPKYEVEFESYSYDGYMSDDVDDTSEATVDVTKLPVTNQKIKCEHCDIAPMDRSELILHRQSCLDQASDSFQFSCDICNKSYSSRHGIKAHMERHMQGSTELASSSKRIKRYKCSTCDERFDKKALLEEHELWHTGATILVCHICGIGKKNKSLMSSHLKTHNPDGISRKTSKSKNSKRYFTCWLCPNRIDFQALDELKLHRKKFHHDFQCKFCKNGFMTNKALQSHILIHSTKDRPHVCKTCGGTFAKIGHLKSHIQGKHAEQKPYPCDKCEKGFVHRYQLQSHIRIFHEKIKAFQCTLCPTSFGHSKSRVWHMRTVHKM